MHGPSRTVTQRTSPSCCWIRHNVGAARSQIAVCPQPRKASSNRYSASIPATRSSYDRALWQSHGHGYGVFTASTTLAGTRTMVAPAMAYGFRIVNVFTAGDDRLSGNPLCVFEDARGLSDAQMQ